MDTNDDKHYKLGVFYYNKGDKSPFVKRRYGFGWSPNYASPIAWIVTLLVIITIIWLVTQG